MAMTMFNVLVSYNQAQNQGTKSSFFGKMLEFFGDNNACVTHIF